jgi:prolyl oligopeptidase
MHGDRFYVYTNEGAPNYRVFAVDPAHPERAAWKEIVPERKDATLLGTAVVGNALSLLYLKDVVTHVELHALDGRLIREVPMPALGSATNLIGDEDEDEAYFSFESFTWPREIWRTSVKNGGADLHFRLDVPIDPKPFTVEQVFYPSKDGTRVPIFIVRRKDQKLDGSAPAILTGYGGFNVPSRPTFSARIYPWLERGGIWAVANLRGGSEYGEDWHRAGMLGNKQNVFDDFLAAGEFLVRSGYTSPARLAIRGGSNGGLLVGAAEAQRPDLFKVVLCHVPLIDMLRYHLFGSGKTWISEYGSAADAAQFQWLHAYSPQQQIREGTRYPATLVLSADADDRVDPMHARKFAAALQAATTGGPVLLRIERHSGHGGADLIKATIEKTADEYAFTLEQMGLAAPPVASR